MTLSEFLMSNTNFHWILMSLVLQVRCQKELLRNITLWHGQLLISLYSITVNIKVWKITIWHHSTDSSSKEIGWKNFLYINKHCSANWVILRIITAVSCKPREKGLIKFKRNQKLFLKNQRSSVQNACR